jgi:aminoglycoside phosphotransferase (APT) family kinase protein
VPLPSSRDREKLRQGLTTWLTEQVGSPVAIDRFDIPEGSGFSSETYLFGARWEGGGGDFVMRMAPAGSDLPVFPSYDLSLQVGAMALVRASTDVPVPVVRWHETSDEPLGNEFYVMERVDGAAASDNPPYLLDGWLTTASVAQRRQVQDRCAEVMARLHAIPIDDQATALLSRPQHGATPLEQHLDHQRWYYDWARDGVDYPIIETALEWLAENRPTNDPVGLNWGDARIGNILFHDFEPAAVVDWEMACLGAPEADVAWQLMLHQFFLDMLSGYGVDNPMPDLFGVRAFAGHYEEISGTKLPDLEWYAAFNHLRFAIISVRTSRRAVSTGEMPAPDDPQELVSNRRLLQASMDGTNPYWED